MPVAHQTQSVLTSPSLLTCRSRRPQHRLPFGTRQRRKLESLQTVRKLVSSIERLTRLQGDDRRVCLTASREKRLVRRHSELVGCSFIESDRSRGKANLGDSI